MDENYEKAAEEKKQGGHRSGVTIPKTKTTPAANLKLKKAGVLENLKNEAVEALNKPTSAQYSNRLKEV
jgi:hypothetical protein